MPWSRRSSSWTRESTRRPRCPDRASWWWTACQCSGSLGCKIGVLRHQQSPLCPFNDLETAWALGIGMKSLLKWLVLACLSRIQDHTPIQLLSINHLRRGEGRSWSRQSIGRTSSKSDHPDTLQVLTPNFVNVRGCSSPHQPQKTPVYSIQRFFLLASDCWGDVVTRTGLRMNMPQKKAAPVRRFSNQKV
jgi:hypothetical protein